MPLSLCPMKKTLFYLLAAVATGLLLNLAWPTKGFVFLLFVAFLPLLFAIQGISQDAKRKKGARIFFTAYLAFALFNLTTTLWVKNAHVSGPIATTFINGGLMAFVFWLYYFVQKKTNAKRALFTLPFFWICLEVLHQDWDMSFPWLDLGNAFADKISWVQWYEYTGHMGGTLWVWAVNIFLFLGIAALMEKRTPKAIALNFVAAVAILIAPILIGKKIYNSYQEQGFAVDVVVVQPNIEAFTEKFELPEEEQVAKFMRIARSKLDSNVQILAGPETLLGYGQEESTVQYSASVEQLGLLIRDFPKLNFVFGLTTFKVFDEADKTPISLPFRGSNKWYEIYNSSTQLNSTGLAPIYHKSKLVVGAEQMPFRWILQPLLGKIVVDLGGMTGSHGTQKERSHFTSADGKIKSASIICWEAEFGAYCTKFAQNGANIFLAITNDGWWGDTDGHRQHLHYARMRAVENRRAVARSANTGISAMINQRGDILQQLPWATEGALRDTLYANNNLTFYTKNGDLIGRVAQFIAVIMLLVALTQRFRRR